MGSFSFQVRQAVDESHSAGEDKDASGCGKDRSWGRIWRTGEINVSEHRGGLPVNWRYRTVRTPPR